MSTIKYKDKNGEEHEFYYCWDMLPEFCAMDQCYAFHDDPPDWYDDWGGGSDEKVVAESRLLRTILMEECRPGTHVFMGDKKDGPGDRLLFSYVPKKPFTVGKIRFKPKLSPYKRNPNSGHDCRYLILETEAVKPKAKKEKAA